MIENPIINFITTHQSTLVPITIFYGTILLFFFLARGKTQPDSKFLFYKSKNLQHALFLFYIYRTEKGIKLIKKIANRNPKLWKKIGTLGIIITVLLMITTTTFMVIGAIHGLIGEAEYARIVPLVPGLTIGGITFPFIIGIISIIITLVLHEGMHGILSVANRIKVKKTGIGLLGPLPFAFVEPDEKQIQKTNHKAKQQIFAAGIFINVIVAIITILTMITIINPIGNTFYPTEGITIEGIEENSPADQANLPINTVYTTINGEQITITKLLSTLQETKPGETITLGTNTKTYEITTTNHETYPEAPYIGIQNPKNQIKSEDTLTYTIFSTTADLLRWIFIVNLGVGAFNSLPLGPTDGGQMFRTAMQKYLGKNKGTKISNIVAISLLIVLIILFSNSFGWTG